VCRRVTPVALRDPSATLLHTVINELMHLNIYYSKDIMNILLVAPTWLDVYGNYKTAAKLGCVSPPLGLIYLGGAILAAGSNCKIVDMESDTVRTLLVYPQQLRLLIMQKLLLGKLRRIFLINLFVSVVLTLRSLEGN